MQGLAILFGVASTFATSSIVRANQNEEVFLGFSVRHCGLWFNSSTANETLCLADL